MWPIFVFNPGSYYFVESCFAASLCVCFSLALCFKISFKYIKPHENAWKTVIQMWKNFKGTNTIFRNYLFYPLTYSTAPTLFTI